MSANRSEKFSDPQLHHRRQQYSASNTSKPTTQSHCEQTSKLNLAGRDPHVSFTSLGKINWKKNFCCCMMFFLVFTIFAYLSKYAKTPTIINEENTFYIRCGRSIPAATYPCPSFLCIKKENIQPALAMIEELLTLLQARTERHICHDQLYPRSLRVSEFARHIYEKEIIVDLRVIESAQYLITCNSQWGVKMVNATCAPIIFNGVDKLLPNTEVFFLLLRPNLPLLCAIRHTFLKFITILNPLSWLISITLVCLLVCYSFWNQESKSVHALADTGKIRIIRLNGAEIRIVERVVNAEFGKDRNY